jgi:putative flippase GtrA
MMLEDLTPSPQIAQPGDLVAGARSTRFWQITRAGAVSFATVAIDVTALTLLIELLGVHVTMAALVGATLGAVTKFVLGKTWAFRDTSRVRLAQVARYLGMVAGSVVLVACSMHVLATLLALPYLVAKGVSGVLVFSGWSYPMQARFVFPRGGR